jgi:hypothetical protein
MYKFIVELRRGFVVRAVVAGLEPTPPRCWIRPCSYYLLGFYLLELLLLLIIHSPAGRPYIYLAIAILLA